MNIFWFRRDLRLIDNSGLFHSLIEGDAVLPIFIFDTNILDDLPKTDQRVNAIYAILEKLNLELKKSDKKIHLFYGDPVNIFLDLTNSYSISGVYVNNDYEPYSIKRDGKVKAFLKSKGIAFHGFKDHVIFEKYEVAKESGEAYKVYTPFMKKWKALLQQKPIEYFPSEKHLQKLYCINRHIAPLLVSMGFSNNPLEIPSKIINIEKISNYHQTRDYPNLKGTTRLGFHLRFGTISIRQLVKKAMEHNEKFLNELIWREFYMMILWHFPFVVDRAFKPQYDKILWNNNDNHFELWKKGQTGIPLVDAGMRQLNATGYMHNRVRMVVASFLTKNLLIDWRWGEAYFAEKLLDYELSSNNGGWQWCAGSGVDAAPYFRVFNPLTQQQKFDPEMKYVKKWIPELGSSDYPAPIIDLKKSRQKAIETYKAAINEYQ